MPTTWTKPQHILSENRKCGASIDLPIEGHCCSTPHCKADCYARVGFQAFPASKRKQRWVSDYLAQSDLSQLIIECKTHTSIRLNGSGDLNQTHLLNIIRLARLLPTTMFWGMTRKPNVASFLNTRVLPNLKMLLSVDSSSPSTVWNYQGPMCYGPRRHNDTVPDDQRIITIFPTHKQGKVKDTVPPEAKDCPAVRHQVSGCLECNRCSSW